MNQLKRTAVAAALAGSLCLALAAAAVPPAVAVVDGERVAAADAPWAASLLLRYDVGLPWTHGCSATVIAPRRVLTARHCLENFAVWRGRVAVGSDRPEDGGGRRLRIARMWVPGLADPDVIELLQPADIAVVETTADLGAPVVPLVPPGAAPADDEAVWAYGFGHTDRHGSKIDEPALLRRALLRLHSDAECADSEVIGTAAICARRGEAPAGGTLGPGDSGGGLMRLRPDGPEIVGVNKSTPQGPHADTLNGFTSVDRMRSFLDAPERGVELPRASRLRPTMTGSPRVGGRMRCRVGWSSAVKRWSVQWTASRRGSRPLRLESGPDGLVVPAAFRGRRLSCMATGTLAYWYEARTESARAVEVRK